MYFYTVLLTITMFSWLVCVRTESVSVLTSKGEIIGQKNDKYNTFYGVPYAQVNESNPFGNSLEYPNFETPFIANDSNIICPQVKIIVGGILQCLRLNIYVPHTANTNHTLPILVWFHGGKFVMGSAGLYDSQHLVQQEIIVITANYRLGPYGFFCLDDLSVPGNQGLKDQIAVLKWVKANIGSFGGDSNKVTIAGESYGGAAIELLLYSTNEILFDKAIIQSSPIYTEGFFVKPDYKAAVKIAKHMGHNVTKTKEALRVLAAENPLEVMAATQNLSITLSVCKEKRSKCGQNFINKDPYHLNNPERIRNMTIIIGYNSKESLGTYLNKPKEFYDDLGDVFYNTLKKNFYLKEPELKALSNIIRRFYLVDKDIGPDAMLELSDFVSDFVFNHAAEWSVNRFVEQGAVVYKYLFSYIGGSKYENITGAGAIHAAELAYLFETDTELATDRQRMIRDRMTTMWAQFVKFGNPTPEPTELLPVTWTPVTGTSRPYMNIDVEMSMRNNLYPHRMAFWDLFWQSYVKKSIVYRKK